MFENYYKILNVIDFAEIEVVKASYRALSKKYHPDVNKKVDPSCMIKINEAYEVLSDEDKKREYDIKLSEYIMSQKSNHNDFDDEVQDHYTYYNYDDYKYPKKRVWLSILGSFIVLILSLLPSFIIYECLDWSASWSYVVYLVFGYLIGSILYKIAKSRDFITSLLGGLVCGISLTLPYIFYFYEGLSLTYPNFDSFTLVIKAIVYSGEYLLGSGIIRLIFVILTPCVAYTTISEAD